MGKASLSRCFFGAFVAMALSSSFAAGNSLQQAEALYYEGLFSRAMAAATRSLTIDGETAEAYSLRAKARIMQAIYKVKNFEAILVEDFTRALALKSNPALFYDRGFARVIVGDIKGATEDFNAAFSAEPDYFVKHDTPYFYWEYRMHHDIYYPFRLNVFVDTKLLLTHTMEYFARGRFDRALRVLRRARRKSAELDEETFELVKESILSARKRFHKLRERDCRFVIGRFFIP